MSSKSNHVPRTEEEDDWREELIRELDTEERDVERLLRDELQELIEELMELWELMLLMELAELSELLDTLCASAAVGSATARNADIGAMKRLIRRWVKKCDAWLRHCRRGVGFFMTKRSVSSVLGQR